MQVLSTSLPSKYIPEMSLGRSNLTTLYSSILPLYQGPSVKLRIQPSDKEYIISKRLLCAESPVFSNMFDGEFLESQQQTATLEETDDDVSARSLEALFQWLYRRIVSFGIEDPIEHISAALELARLADKYDISGLETTMAEYIRNIIISNPHPQSHNSWRHVDSNTYYLHMIILPPQPCCLEGILSEMYLLLHLLKASFEAQNTSSAKRLTPTLLSAPTFSNRRGLSYIG